MTLSSLIKNTNPIAGRWVIIYQDEKGTYLFSDLSGLRQIYYATDGKNTWCASQPELIKTKIKLKKNDNKDVLNFLLNPKLGSRESLWGGTSTIYQRLLSAASKPFFRFRQFRAKAILLWKNG